jgi:hypothetical protein
VLKCNLPTRQPSALCTPSYVYSRTLCMCLSQCIKSYFLYWSKFIEKQFCFPYLRVLFICRLFSDAFFSNAGYSVEWEGDEWMMKWKGFGRER